MRNLGSTSLRHSCLYVKWSPLPAYADLPQRTLSGNSSSKRNPLKVATRIRLNSIPAPSQHDIDGCVHVGFSGFPPTPPQVESQWERLSLPGMNCQKLSGIYGKFMLFRG